MEILGAAGLIVPLYPACTPQGRLHPAGVIDALADELWIEEGRDQQDCL